jgi:hypothetical protein
MVKMLHLQKDQQIQAKTKKLIDTILGIGKSSRVQSGLEHESGPRISDGAGQTCA